MGSDVVNSIWVTIILLSFLVMVHEFGHFIMARLFGVRVHEFSVGFGPLIGKTVRNGIQYSARWVLLGGFVKIAGMDIALEGEGEGEKVPPEESFNFLPLWKRVVVIAAGPIFNVLLAVALFFGTATLVGLPSTIKNDAPVIMQSSPTMPAFDAGIKSGDRVVSINNQPIKKWNDISESIQKFGAHPLKIRILRQGKLIEKTVTPIYSKADKRYQIGVSAYFNLSKLSVPEAAKRAVSYPWNFTNQVVKVFAMMFRGEVKGGLMGPIGMVTITAQNISLPLNYFIFYIFSSAISISMFLFLFNMLPLPLPLLDGGWIIIMLLERALNRDFTPGQKAAAQMVGLVAILILGIWIAYGDVLSFIKFFKGG